ncbi:MAG: helix-turn-helix transcriptional regulator [Anaerovoracaceae bacterium]
MTKNDIALILKYARINADLTQEYVASVVNKKQQTVNSWESAHSQPDANTLFTLCKLYNISMDELFLFSTKENFSLEIFSNYALLNKTGRIAAQNMMKALCLNSKYVK